MGRRNLRLQHNSVELSARPVESPRAKTVHHRSLRLGWNDSALVPPSQSLAGPRLGTLWALSESWGISEGTVVGGCTTLLVSGPLERRVEKHTSMGTTVHPLHLTDPLFHRSTFPHKLKEQLLHGPHRRT